MRQEVEHSTEPAGFVRAQQFEKVLRARSQHHRMAVEDELLCGRAGGQVLALDVLQLDRHPADVAFAIGLGAAFANRIHAA